MLVTKSVAERVYEAPPLRNMILELTALAEIPLFYTTRCLLRRMLRRGDGHPVLVLPGFMASDASTAAMRRLLEALGYAAPPWELGSNPGVCERFNKQVRERVEEVASAAGDKVSLIGWSAGGMHARVTAHLRPDIVRQVITLGSPFGIDYREGISGVVGRLYERTNDGLDSEPMIESGLMAKSPPVPSTSIVSRTDGLAYWKFSLDVSDDATENIVVPGSHSGMTHNPVIMALVAERLGQAMGHWQPFRPGRYDRKFFKPVCATEVIPRWVRQV